MMSRFFFAAVLLLSCLIPAEAALLDEKWSESEVGTLPEGWSTWGSDMTPAGYAATLFEKGEGFKVMPLSPDSPRLFAVSYSSSTEGGNVSTALVTPSVEMPAAGGVLMFSAANYNPDGSSSNKMAVYVSDSGITETDFSTKLLTVRVPANNAGQPAVYCISLSDYAGKKIHLAFVNEGNNAGLLGITDIMVGDYVAEIHDTTSLLYPIAKKITPEISLSILAPCNGFTATLTTDTGYTQTLKAEGWLGDAIMSAKLNFSPIPVDSPKTPINYRVTVMPSMEGVEPTEAAGSTGCGKGFPAVLVEEEATGENCGYCPAGAASIEKFSDEFGDRFIGFGIHCANFSTGVMENHEYSDPFMYNPFFSISSLPSAVFNRREIVNPTDYSSIQEAAEQWMAQKSGVKATISKMSCDEATGESNLVFDVETALPYGNAQLACAAVVIADGLTGFGPKWYQKDYFSGTSKESFLKNADESWWQYMQFYCEYPSELISPTDMPFNHVAMGIYPDFYGDDTLLSADWSESQSQSATLSFEMPMQHETNGFGVQDIRKTSVALLIIDSRSGEIVAGAKINADDYDWDNSSLKNVGLSPATICQADGGIRICVEEECSVTLFTPDGRIVGNEKLSSGEAVVKVNTRGPIIVNVVTPQGIMTRKVMMP